MEEVIFDAGKEIDELRKRLVAECNEIGNRLITEAIGKHKKKELYDLYDSDIWNRATEIMKLRNRYRIDTIRSKIMYERVVRLKVDSDGVHERGIRSVEDALWLGEEGRIIYRDGDIYIAYAGDWFNLNGYLVRGICDFTQEESEELREVIWNLKHGYYFTHKDAEKDILKVTHSIAPYFESFLSNEAIEDMKARQK